jgi:hypothetical protein
MKSGVAPGWGRKALTHIPIGPARVPFAFAQRIFNIQGAAGIRQGIATLHHLDYAEPTLASPTRIC